jgi:hypothetical protein
MRGGYYPAIYDTSRDYRAEERGGKESDLLGANYTRYDARPGDQGTCREGHGADLARSWRDQSAPGEVIHDITHRRP